MKRVLVTGGRGFIGRHCLPRLAAAGYEIHAVTNHAVAESRLGLEWHRADLFDAPGVRALIRKVSPSHLLHLAWVTEPGVYWTSPENLRWVAASLELLHAFREAGGVRAVAAGTCAEYDWSDGICTEATTPLVPATPYGAAKHALQVELGVLSAQLGLSSAWGRIFFLYGPHEHRERLVPSVIRALLSGEPARCTHGNQLRDFLHVADVADAFVSLFASTVTGAVNIGSGEPVAIREVIGRIGTKLQAPELLRFGALPTREGEPPLLVANVERLRSDLGWKPKFDLDRGLDHAIAWWKSEAASRVGQP